MTLFYCSGWRPRLKGKITSDAGSSKAFFFATELIDKIIPLNVWTVH